ncbi:Crp/Fnr family transcriptional regulator [Pseudorhodobacter sp. W20_MBD10_FR17]|uniref:Crp/Fnr family transcriptional regulator n=1 Tax=Pseudorhodobacter sp. W20_MBD10_FR17 TaxID=3240266 RepID=UPI003F971D11
MSYQPGEEIAPQGERSEKLGIVASGVVKIVLITEDGENHLLQLVEPGEFVGDPCQKSNVFSWEAATPSSICWINRQALDGMMQENPQLNRAYIGVIAHQLETQRLWTAAMRGRNTLQRIAFWIYQQIPKTRDFSAPLVQVNLTRRDLASLLDMTVETLCRGLHQLSERGAIDLITPTKIRVTNRVKLQLFARHEQCGIDKLLNSARDVKPGKALPCFSKAEHRETIG